ncbi:hypothetical protein [Dactylosporangium darangshiense]|uniref:Uncharacterized protein n=1 Tax=Dactylosporangium darangshiense TaxID=579108 RepID=A0ABP8DNF6_9ACTN
MGAHRGPIRVYGAPWLLWLAPLLSPATTLWLSFVTAAALIIGRVLIFVNIVTVIALAAVVVALWLAAWVARLTTRYVVIADRYRWERVDRVCDAIAKHLPSVSALGRREVRSAVQAARWDLACLIRDQSRLMNLQQATRRSTQGLAADDPLHGELDLRHTLLTEQLRSIETEIEQRFERLQSLAVQSTALATEEAESQKRRATAERARRTLAQVDASIAEVAAWGNRTDPAADFTERAEAVLAAYRELNDDPLTWSAERRQQG